MKLSKTLSMENHFFIKKMNSPILSSSQPSGPQIRHCTASNEGRGGQNQQEYHIIFSNHEGMHRRTFRKIILIKDANNFDKTPNKLNFSVTMVVF